MGYILRVCVFACVCVCVSALTAFDEDRFIDTEGDTQKHTEGDTHTGTDTDTRFTDTHTHKQISEFPENAQMFSIHNNADKQEDLLHWAIRNSDPETLKKLAASVSANAHIDTNTNADRLTWEELMNKDVRNQVYKALFTTETTILEEKIGVLRDLDSKNDKQKTIKTLMTIEELASQIDNAANLHKMGGLIPIVYLALDSSIDFEIRLAAFWVLGTAAQNNPSVQSDLHNLDAIPRMIKTLSAECTHKRPAHEGMCVKAIFALTAAARNDHILIENTDVLKWALTEGLLCPSKDTKATRYETKVALRSLSLLDDIILKLHTSEAENPHILADATVSCAWHTLGCWMDYSVPAFEAHMCHTCKPTAHTHDLAEDIERSASLIESLFFLFIKMFKLNNKSPAVWLDCEKTCGSDTHTQTYTQCSAHSQAYVMKQITKLLSMCDDVEAELKKQYQDTSTWTAMEQFGPLCASLKTHTVYHAIQVNPQTHTHTDTLKENQIVIT